ncbi:MAG TPA: helix-turn-helix domain-containing protein [Acidimicrobiales bacterium]|nr:helix-turn-helix domain-containing protein [Acidimicrobiales bacterium]
MSDQSRVSPLTAAFDGDGDADVGRRLRQVRRARRRTLRDVATEAGISEGFLSQIERGRANASVATLRRIASVVGVTMSELFHPEDPGRPAVLRAGERPTLGFGVMGQKWLVTLAPDRELDAFVARFDPGGSTGDEPYAHGDSEELLVVRDGQVRLELGDQVFDLGPDDSLVYRSSVPHRLSESAGESAEVLFVTTPPSF